MSSFIVATGNTAITVTAELENVEASDEQQQDAFMFLFFVLLQ